MKPNKATIIGLTGGIATGKSTVSNILISKGYALIDADKIARQVTEINRPAYLKIIEQFGEDILKNDKFIDRKKLGSIIFKDENARETLNGIIHPYVFEEIKSEIMGLSKGKTIIFIDIPLLFEQFHEFKKYGIEFDEIWLVYASKEIQTHRLMKRDDISKEEAWDKIGAQISINEKKLRATKIIDNNEEIENLYIQLDKLLVELI